MIFATFNQLNNCLIFIFLGFIIGYIFSIIKIIFLLNFSKNIKKNIIFSVFYMFFSCFYIFFINIFNFGLLNFVLLLCFILGFVWNKKLLNNLVVFCENKWYNIITYLKNSKGKTCKTTTKKSKQ